MLSKTLNNEERQSVKEIFFGFCKAEKPHLIYENLNRVSFFGKWSNGLLATSDAPSTYSAINEVMIGEGFSNFGVLKEKICSQDCKITIIPYTKYETTR